MTPNEKAEKYFESQHAHGDLSAPFIKSLKFLGEYTVHGGGENFKADYASTLGIIFGGTIGMHSICWRLRETDYYTALKTGAKPAADIGAEWVAIDPFRADWPKPDLPFWALRAYDFARTGK